MINLDVLFFTFSSQGPENQIDSNINVGYAKLGASDRKALSKVDNWEVFSTICQTPAVVDEKVKRITRTLLKDYKFQSSWNFLIQTYGQSPSISITTGMPNIRQRNLEIPTVADETKGVATINPTVSLDGTEKHKPIQPKTITILGPPELTCPNELFPSAAIVCLVYNVFVLKILVQNGDNNQTLTKALEQTAAWIIANRQSGGMLDLDECPENDRLLILKAPTITLSLSFTSGKRSIQKIEIT